MVTAEARKQAAAAVAPTSTPAETPIVVGSEKVLPTAVAEMTKEEQRRLATKRGRGAARYSEARKANKKISYDLVIIEGVALFGKDAMPPETVLLFRHAFPLLVLAWCTVTFAWSFSLNRARGTK